MAGTALLSSCEPEFFGSHLTHNDTDSHPLSDDRAEHRIKKPPAIVKTTLKYIVDTNAIVSAIHLLQVLGSSASAASRHPTPNGILQPTVQSNALLPVG